MSSPLYYIKNVAFDRYVGVTSLSTDSNQQGQIYTTDSNKVNNQRFTVTYDKSSSTASIQMGTYYVINDSGNTKITLSSDDNAKKVKWTLKPVTEDASQYADPNTFLIYAKLDGKVYYWTLPKQHSGTDLILDNTYSDNGEAVKRQYWVFEVGSF